MKHEFVHCNMHSEFSLLDGASKVKDIVANVAEKGMTAVALTDNAVMYGAIDFYQKAKSAGIKPLIGCEVYIAPKGRLEKTSKSLNHLVIIAQNEKGYKNLVKLVSNAFLEGFYYKPRIDHEIMTQYAEGLIVLSSGLDGEIASALLRDNYEQARKAAVFYKEAFGDNYYLEIQDHGLPEEQRINPKILRLAKELEIKVAATNDSHYTKKEDALAREVLTCIQSGRKLEDRYRLESEEHYIKSPEEMYQVFHEIPEALKNTVEIAEKCNLIISMGKSILPHFPLPPGHTAESYLQKTAMEGLKVRYKELTPEINKRFHYEMEIINKMGFAAYFLIVWDYINYARKKGIQVGPGRGSAAGSIIAYTLGITDIDPLPYNLLFERFLNPERISMPDVDTDFCIDRRGEVIQYVGEKYGSTNVSQIVTLGTLGAKQVIRDVSKVLGYSVAESEKLSKMIPKGVGIKLKDALADGLDLKKACEENPKTQEIVDLSLKLEGLARHSSIHAAGVVISKDPLDTIVPLEKNKDGTIISQYQMTELEKLGLLKMDFLGLRNLTMISNALDILERKNGLRLDLNEISFDDEKSYELLSSGKTVGVFQLESSGMQKLVMDLKPNCFEEIIALIALYRPGPLGSGMVTEFVERKHGKAITYPHPSIEPVLKDTYGLIVYQEQIMQISQIIAGYTLGQADILRKAMGKKKLDEMLKQRETFLEGAAKNGVSQEIASELFDTMEKFAEYGFNKSHSAAYAVITYRTAYLKANYPIEYMAALISSVMNNPDKVPIYTAETKRMGIKILQPDVNSSESGFSVDETSIRFGLKAVKGVGENVINEIVETREKIGGYKSLYEFCRNVSAGVLNRKAVESLIKAGAFDSVNKNRRQLLEGMDETYASAIKKQKDESSGQTSLFGLAEESSGESFDEAPELPYVQPYSEEENLNIEKQVLGLFVSGHPLDKYSTQLERFCTQNTCDLPEMNDGISVTIGGIISNCRTMLTKKMDTMAVLTLEDLTGSIEVVVYPESYGKFNQFLANDTKVLLHGKINARDEDVKVILSAVSLLSSIPYLEIRIPDSTSMLKLVSMRSILQELPGETPVILNYLGSNVEIITGKEYWITEKAELIDRLKQMFAAENVNMLV
jgi:DNA polymerase-3 subunit alpha